MWPASGPKTAKANGKAKWKPILDQKKVKKKGHRFKDKR